MRCLNPAPRVSLSSEPVVVVDPLNHSGWDSLLSAHPGHSFFHSSAWARVLGETYGHRPLYFCRLEKDRLIQMLPVMEVSSPLTGKRGVSLPFTDSCFMLKVAGVCDSSTVFEAALNYGTYHGWRYLECRGNGVDWPGSTPSLGFLGHVIDLEAGAVQLFEGLDGSTRRGIRKAERAGVKVEFLNGPEAMREFFRLHCLSRRRHGVPPQPFRFFENISKHVIEAGLGFVVLAHVDGRAIAGGVYFHHGRQAIYKFGASNFYFQSLRANDLVMWEAMKRYSAEGYAQLHLGRSSLANVGLRRFKAGFGSREESIEYQRYDFHTHSFVTDVDRAESWLNPVMRLFPGPLLRLAGSLIYPHLS